MLQLGLAFRQRGARVVVVSAGEGPLRAEYEAAGVAVRVLPMPAAPEGRGASRLALLSYLLRLRRLARRERVDLFYVNTLGCYPAVLTARAVGLPCVWCVRESVAPGSPEFPRLRWARAVFSRHVHIVFVAEATRRLYTPLLDATPSHVIPNGLDQREIDAYCARVSVDAARERVGLRPGERAVVVVGTTCRRKGQHVFVDAALTLRRRWSDTRFLLVGARDGEFLSVLRERVGAADALDRVHFVYETPDVYDYYRAADVCVLSSFEESHPRVVLEAMAFARPLVATRVFGVPEQVTDAEAVLVPAGQPLALAAGIEGLLADPQAAEAMALRARARFERDFRIESTVAAHLRLLEQILF